MGCDKRVREVPMLAAAAVLILAGCAGAPVDKTLQAEELLGTAGFQAQNTDPRWGDGADWEDALLGGS